MKRSFLSTLVLGACFAAGSASAQIITYGFDSGALPPTQAAANISGGNFSSFSGAGATSIAGVPSLGGGDYFTAADWDGVNYFTFTLTAAEGYTFDIDSISFYYLSGVTGPTAGDIRSSVDGFAASVTLGSLTNNGEWNAKSTSISLSSLSSVTIRLEATGASGLTPALETLQIDSVQISGSLSAVPEPSAFATIAGLGMLGFAVSRRRSRPALGSIAA